MSDFPTYPTYEQMHQACENLVDQLKANAVINGIEAVVAVARGGLFNGVVLSHMLNKPLICIDYSSNGGAGDNYRMHSNVIDHIGFGNLLLVDDIADSGHTLREIYHTLMARGHNIITYTTFYKESSVFSPDFEEWIIPANAPWIIFPFEVDPTK